MGYNPYTNQFEMVVKTSQPQEPHILRCAAHHPQLKLFNLPLSLLNLLNYADRIGCSDAMLKTILIIFLQSHVCMKQCCGDRTCTPSARATYRTLVYPASSK